jgi:hypothetical protein
VTTIFFVKTFLVGFVISIVEKCEDTKGIIRIRRSKVKPYNGEKKEDKEEHNAQQNTNKRRKD